MNLEIMMMEYPDFSSICCNYVHSHDFQTYFLCYSYVLVFFWIGSVAVALSKIIIQVE